MRDPHGREAPGSASGTQSDLEVGQNLTEIATIEDLSCEQDLNEMKGVEMKGFLLAYLVLHHYFLFRNSASYVRSMFSINLTVVCSGVPYVDTPSLVPERSEEAQCSQSR